MAHPTVPENIRLSGLKPGPTRGFTAFSKQSGALAEEECRIGSIFRWFLEIMNPGFGIQDYCHRTLQNSQQNSPLV
jgi:hypothetical protein